MTYSQRLWNRARGEAMPWDWWDPQCETEHFYIFEKKYVFHGLLKNFAEEPQLFAQKNFQIWMTKIDWIIEVWKRLFYTNKRPFWVRATLKLSNFSRNRYYNGVNWLKQYFSNLRIFASFSRRAEEYFCLKHQEMVWKIRFRYF